VYVDVSLYVNVSFLEAENREVLLRELLVDEEVVEATELETKVVVLVDELIFEVLVAPEVVCVREIVAEDVVSPVVDIVDELVVLVNVELEDVATLLLLEGEPTV
jgi:hypothetical protein